MSVSYEVVRSARKTLALQVTRNGSVIVRAPYFTSEKKIGQFVSEHEAWIAKALEKQKKAPQMSDDPQVLAGLYERAREVLPGKIAAYAERMRLYPQKVSFGRAKTRFGCCTSRKTIVFSVYLMLYPDEAIDYVVVHELAHLKYMNHGKRFYALVSSVLPDYKERRKLLK